MMKVSALILVCVLGLSLGFEDKTVVQWLVDNNYNTLVTAVTTAGLASTLSTSGPFTVFAPTDAAFNKLGAAAIQGLLDNPSQLAIILQYHVVNKFVLVPMVNGPTIESSLTNEDLNLAPYNGGLIINNASIVSSSTNDIVCNNGVVQPIDTVLMAPNLPSFTITQYLIQDTRFKDLTLALLLNALTGALDSGDFTLFAPVDSAFAVLNPSQSNDQTAYTDILKYHVVPGARMASQLSDGQVLYTLQGTTLKVTINSSGVMINNARVIDPNLMCTNGVIHAIDTILVPGDLAQSTSG